MVKVKNQKYSNDSDNDSFPKDEFDDSAFEDSDDEKIGQIERPTENKPKPVGRHLLQLKERLGKH